MIIFKDKSSFQFNSELPNINLLAYNDIKLLENEELIEEQRKEIQDRIDYLDTLVYVIDDILQYELSTKIKDNFPYIDFILENNKLTDVTILEKPAKPKTDMEILQERLLQIEVLQVNSMSMQIENKLLGGIV